MRLFHQAIRSRHLPRPVPSTILSRFSIWLAGIFALLQGIVIIAAAEERFTAPAFTVLSAIRGGMTTWGVVLSVIGAIILVSSWKRAFWAKTLAMSGCALWCLSFGLGTLTAAAMIPTASVTGPGVYFFAGAFCTVLAFVDERNAP